VTWTWTNTGSTPHSVESEGTISFASSPVLTGSGKTYTVTFMTPGTYEYDCAVHGEAMSGTIVVQ
jgi:plastocyanin